ncbi:unnamed protein product [Mycena citricolor]|uniref:Uncharacterized protein n=1 Tax=Mycena citricolor TaxID=2018698 RepID=A0AAD2HYA2_9AGAR|nr:unnamed protein product [Mycena citricolor]CAK5283519.1 unnamed protein product [Mycena citricolor]
MAIIFVPMIIAWLATTVSNGPQIAVTPTGIQVTPQVLDPIKIDTFQCDLKINSITAATEFKLELPSAVILRCTAPYAGAR